METVLEAANPPATLQQYRDDLRITKLYLPKEHSRRRQNGTQYELRGSELETWREGFRNGIEHALELLESLNETR